MKRLSTLLSKEDILNGDDPLIQSVCHNLDDCDKFSAFFSNDLEQIEKACEKDIACIFTSLDLDKSFNKTYVKTNNLDQLYFSISSTLIYNNQEKLDIILCDNNYQAHALYSMLGLLGTQACLVSENFINTGLGLEKHDNKDIFDYHNLFPLFNTMTENKMIIVILATKELPFVKVKDFEVFDININYSLIKQKYEKDLQKVISIASNYCLQDLEELILLSKEIKTPYDVIKTEDDYTLDPTYDLELSSKYKYTIVETENIDFLEKVLNKANKLIIVSKKKPLVDCFDSFKCLKSAKEVYTKDTLLLGKEFLN